MRLDVPEVKIISIPIKISLKISKLHNPIMLCWNETSEQYFMVNKNNKNDELM